MREPDFSAADPYLRLAHAQYCEALQHIAVVLSHLPNAHIQANLYAAGASIHHLEQTVKAAKEAYLAYAAMITRAEGEA